MKSELIGVPFDEFQNSITKLGEKPFRAKQLWQWVYHKGETNFENMTNISKESRKKFAENFNISRPEITQDLKSVDGTRKWLIKFSDCNEVEMVFIPEEERGTLCVSSQVGCTLTCKFCHTGTQRLVRNLTAGEILSQLLIARDCLEDWPSAKEDRKITNIVMMGMGEPLYNYENVSKALKIIMDPEGIAISRRKITLSTSGVLPEIDRCGKELGVNLAISLHAPNNKVRTPIMPINNKYPIEELIETCKNYEKLVGTRRITFEYVMLKDVNDSIENAKELAKLLKGIHCIINIIPFNIWPGAIYECSDDAQIKKFARILLDAAFTTTVRTPRGEDILAACGQLKSASEKMKKSLLETN